MDVKLFHTVDSINSKKSDYWKLSTILVSGLFIGYLIGHSVPKKSKVSTPTKIELIIKSDSNTIKNSTFKVKNKSNSKVEISKLPLTEKNLKKELIRQNIKYPNIVLAQAELESNLGKSDVATSTNNLFGLRKGKRYRRFGHWTESVKAYKNLIQSKYSGGNYYTFLNKIGYAEDPSYTDKLKDLV